MAEGVLALIRDLDNSERMRRSSMKLSEMSGARDF